MHLSFNLTSPPFCLDSFSFANLYSNQNEIPTCYQVKMALNKATWLPFKGVTPEVGPAQIPHPGPREVVIEVSTLPLIS